MAVPQCIYSGLSFNGFCYTALNTTYYMLHYTLAPTVSLLHSLPFKMSFFRLSEHSDIWVQPFTLNFNVSMIYIYEAQGKFVICVVSDECIFEILFPTITSESADSSLDPAIRSVCVCVYVRVYADTMHKTLYCEKKSLQVFFNCVSTQFSCCRLNGLLCVSFFLINYS